MSQGAAWVDEIMRPLAGWCRAADYNVIYTTVMKLGAEDGRRLVQAIANLAERA